LHDRRLANDLKIFCKRNAGVSRDPMKETRLREGDTIYSMTDFNWAPLTTMRHVIDALLNFTMALACIWSWDLTGSMLHKLYNSYSWFSYNIKEELKIKIITCHFRRVSEANASRALEQGSPCKYYECERILKLVLAEEGLDTSPPRIVAQHAGAYGQQQPQQSSGQAARGSSNAGKGRGRGGRQGGNQRGTGGAGMQKPPAVTPNGRKICFAFNKPQGCQNPPISGGPGCKDPKSQSEFAHCCSWFFPTTGTYCLQGHSKCQH
jgi:hypothetical protein